VGKTQTGAQEPFRSARASRVDRAPKLDGTLNDPLWQQATPISNFLQREPFEGQAPTEHTEVRILYTRNEVYFGITCFDSNPAGIVTTELRRDVSQELDDYFEIVIDSAHDRRNAYVFQVNPLGTQRDALITEEQRTDTSLGDGDSGWDGVWTSEARKTQNGWTLTVGIPFATLNFMQSRNVIWESTLNASFAAKMKRIFGPVGDAYLAPYVSARPVSCMAYRTSAADACLS
jgi:hypothetical protein